MSGSQGMRTRLETLKSQRWFLRIMFLLEFITSAVILLVEVANYFAYQPDYMMRRLDGTFTTFDKIVDQFNSSVFIMYLLYEIFPFLCLFLQIGLIRFTRRNKSQPVTGKECVWFILLCVQLPSFVWWMSTIDFFLDTLFPPVNRIAEVFILFSIFVLNILLLRNLRQYTRAIRLEAEHMRSCC